MGKASSAGRAGTATGNVGSVPRAPAVPQSLLDVLAGLNVPHLDQYFGVWAIQEDPFRAAVARVGSIDIRAHVEARQGEGFDDPDYSFPRIGSTAIIRLSGPLMKQRSSMSGGTSTIEARRQIRNAGADKTIESILLRFDSPGGTVAGTADLADDIAAVSKRKNTVSYIEDLGASAAYWAASQARKVYCGRTAIVGSIGTFMVVFDASKMADKDGVKVHVVRAGEFKGAGTLGTEITDEQLAEWQRTVNDLNEHFIRGVAAGRKMTLRDTRELATGQVWIGQEALEKRLVDGVQSLDETLAQLQGTSSGKQRGTKAMSQEIESAAGELLQGELMEFKPAHATLAELKTALPKASAEFLVSQLEGKATVEQAVGAYAKLQEARAEAAEKLAAENDAKAKAAAGKPGVDPLTDKASGKSGEESEASYDGDPIAAYNAAIDVELKRGKTRAQAASIVTAKQPELHEAMIVAHNLEHGRKKALAKSGRI